MSSFSYHQALLVADFGPRITIKIVESLRDDIYAGKLKSGSEIKVMIQMFCTVFLFNKISEMISFLVFKSFHVNVFSCKLTTKLNETSLGGL